MNFEELMLKRESCRAYQDKPVSREDIKKVLEAGILAPSACNSQPWKFLVIDEPEAKAKLCDALVTDDGKTGAPWRDQVPAFILFVEQKANVVPMVIEHYNDSQRFAAGDLGAACVSMCYRAAELGLSTCIIGLANEKKMEELLNIPDGLSVRCVLAVGYAKEDAAPRKKVRKDFDEVVCFNEYK